MNLITDIKPALKSENRVNIFVDGKFDFSLDVAQVVDLHIKVGKHLTPSELSDCRHASEFGKLYTNALEYVLSRPHSIKEVRDHLILKRTRRELMNRQAINNRKKPKDERIKFKLRTKEIPLYTDQDIDNVISRLTEKGYLDDAKFTTFYIENRFYKKGISKKRLVQELHQKGISSDIIETVMADTGRSDADEIKKIIEKKKNKYTEDKLIAYLVRQGFDYQQSKDAVREMDLQN